MLARQSPSSKCHVHSSVLRLSKPRGLEVACGLLEFGDLATGLKHLSHRNCDGLIVLLKRSGTRIGSLAYMTEATAVVLTGSFLMYTFSIDTGHTRRRTVPRRTLPTKRASDTRRTACTRFGDGHVLGLEGCFQGGLGIREGHYAKLQIAASVRPRSNHCAVYPSREQWRGAETT